MVRVFLTVKLSVFTTILGTTLADKDAREVSVGGIPINKEEFSKEILISYGP